MAKRKVQQDPGVDPRRPGIAQHGMAQQTVHKMAKQGTKQSGGHPSRPITSGVQGSSLANMGDGMTAGGHNAPRGYFASNEVARGGAAGGGSGSLFKGSTPLAKTGTSKKKYSPASHVIGNFQ